MSRRTLWRPRPQGDVVSSEERSHRWRHFWRLLGSYWVSNQWKIAWPMFATMVGLSYASVSTMLMMTMWEKALFDALSARQASALVPLVLQFFEISMLTVGIGLVQMYVGEMLKMRWRAWLTADYVERWLRHDRYLDIERTGMIDNPDQRIAEDLDIFSKQTLEVVLGVIQMVMGAVTFGGVLWAASDSIAFSLGGALVSIPGDLLIYAVLYSVGGTWFISLVGKPLVRWTIEQQHLGANFRFRLINVRRNAEQIAFARTIASEWRRLTGDFTRIVRNFRGLQIRQQYVGATSGLYGSIGNVLPVFLLMPKYFAGQMTLGTVMQNRGAFGAFNGALSYFVQAYTTIAALIATITRIRHLDWAIASPTPSGIRVAADQAAGVTATDLRLETPRREPLLSIGSWHVEPGQRWTVRGPSGIGKSTLLRAVAGIWPYGSGTVSMPAEGHTMFVSQRTFLPIGTLREALSFPAEPDAFDTETFHEVLITFRLEALCDDLDVEAVWQDRLSPGEQQRLSFARVLLHKPTTLFLDEATSALDVDNANHAYQALLGTLPGLTLISVVHDPKLDAYHNRRLEVLDGIARCVTIPDALEVFPEDNIPKEDR